MKIQVIDNVAPENSVDDISECTAKHHGVSQGLCSLTAVADKFDEKNRDDNGYCDKKVSLPATAIGKETKGSASIPYMHPVKKWGDFNGLTINHGLLNEPLYALVGQCY